MNTFLAFMSTDHDRLEDIFKEFKKRRDSNRNEAKRLFHDFKIGLQKHIVWEEEILFPIFEQKTGMHDSGPTAVMRMEHRQIKSFLEEIHKKLLADELEGIEAVEADLLEVLRLHNQKEENVLYPAIDNLVNEQEREEAFSDMQDVPPEKYE